MDKAILKASCRRLPMDGGGALHEESLRAVFESNVEAGVHGFWVAGGTGESILLSDGENRRIAGVADQTESKILCTWAPATEHAVVLARMASVGVEAICCFHLLLSSHGQRNS